MTLSESYLIKTEELDIYSHMAFDEVMLDWQPSMALSLRFYKWKRASWQIPAIEPKQSLLRAVSFGYGQNYDEVYEVVSKRAGAVVFPLVRRVTGGGVVYHDNELTFSLVFPWPGISSPLDVYKDIHMAIYLGLKTVGVLSQLWHMSPPSLGAKINKECFAQAEPKDLVNEDGVKLVGGALRRRKALGLYQGSMRLADVQRDKKTIEKGIQEGCSIHFLSVFSVQEPEDKILNKIKELADMKYKKDSWNKRR